MLSLETSTSLGSIVVWEDGELLFSERFEQPRGRSEALLQVLEQAIQKVERVDRIAVGIGPGSYNGIRSAISAAEGLKIAWEIDVFGIPSILGTVSSHERYAVVGDARGNSMFFGEIFRENLEDLCLLPRREFEKRLEGWPGVVYTATPLSDFPHFIIQTPTAERIAALAALRTECTKILTPLYLKSPCISQSNDRLGLNKLS